MNKYIVAIICVATFAFVAVVQADQVRFYSRMPSGVEKSQDIHYTVIDVNGNKIAEDSVTNPEGVTINGLPSGTYFLSAEQPSTGYFGSKTVEVTDAGSQNPGEDENQVVLGPEGLREYDPAAPQPAAAETSTPTSTVPESSIPYEPATSNVGRWAFALGAAGLACGIVGIFTPDKSVSNVAK